MMCRKLFFLISFVLLVCLASNASASLVAHWQLENNVSDSAGNNDGTVQGNPSYVTGYIGTGMDFDGSDDYVEFPALNLNSNTVTITSWIKRDGTQSIYSGLVYTRAGNSIAGLTFGSTADWQPNNEIAYNWNDNQSAWSWDSGLVVPDNAWTFVAVVVSPSNAVMYMDTGTLSSSTNTVSNAADEWDGIGGMANDFYSGGRFFNGVMDDVRIYNHSLTQTEIEAVIDSAEEDTTAPTPDPMTWATVPYETGSTSISMTATTASDASGVEYYFDCTAGGGNDSGWQDNTTYEDTGLSPATQYTYRVQARDKSTNQNATGWSSSLSATTETPPEDTTPPTPDPMTWATEPHATGTTSISMTATTASDYSGVEYNFDCTAGGGNDSGWQDSTTYTDTGLSELTQYTYRVQARDKSNNQNATAWSSSISATTEDGTAPTPNPATWAAVPAATGMYSISMTATTASDASGVEYNFDCTTAGGHDSGWQNSPTYEDSGLSEGTQYTYRVEARDKSTNQNTTAFSTSQSATTQSDSTAPTPDPITWATEPVATGTSSITMTATTASDISGVEYSFDCTAGGGHDSGWQDSPTYEDTDLTASTQYTYRVQARDKSSSQNATAWSTSKSATTDSAPSIDPDLVAWFEFQNDVTDSTDNGNNGTINGNPSYVTGHIGNGMDFDGSDDYVGFPALNLNSNTVTITSWIKRDGTQSIFSGLVCTRAGSSVAGMNFGSTAGWQPNNQLQYNWNNDQDAWSWQSGLVVPNNTWTFAALVLQPSQAVIYMDDGTLDSATNTLSHAAEAWDGVGGIANDFYSGGRFFNGVMDDVRIYQRVLTQAEIENLVDGVQDTTPPSPDPMTWSSVPAATGVTSISMTATTATDDSGVEYFFDCTTAGGHDSGWQNSATYEDTGLSENTQYTYRVQARDKSTNANATAFSTSQSATTQTDSTAPEPDPMTWSAVPAATGTTSISMTATTASDPRGVEYSFDCTAGGGNDSGWQDGTSYEDTGLSPGTQYTYRVQARDKSAGQNTTAWSGTESATTDSVDSTPPSPDPMTWSAVPAATGPGSISMVATTATDASGVEYYFDCTAGGGHDSGWQDSPSYEDTGLSASTQYTYRVMAADKSPNQNETAWSTSASATTDAAAQWTGTDVGSVGQSGSYSGTYSIDGGGADIWGTADSFYYVYQSLTGDGEIWARVASIENTHEWAKSGVMIRASLNANSQTALMSITPSHGSQLVYRTSAGGSAAADTPEDGFSAPSWVRLVRSGNTFTGYKSSNGSNWTSVGSHTISMPSDVYIGMAVCAHNNSTLCTSALDSLYVDTGAPPPAPGQASNPSPANSATNVSISADLSWTAGDYAASHDVYFGTDSSPDETELMGNQSGTTYDPGTLSTSTTYYWRIDEKNVTSTTTGTVWSFTTAAPSAPGQASNPNPSNGATGISTSANLGWSAGSAATSHDVYFGTDSTPDSGEFQGNQSGTSYDPGSLSYSTTYYWRIDEKNAEGTTTGIVWSFTTTSSSGTRDPLLWPFAQNSCWNMPIGSNASYVNAQIADTTEGMYTDPDILVLTPGQPMTGVYVNNAGWGGGDRCPVQGGLIVTVPMPSNFTVPSGPGTPNHSCALLMSDGHTLHQSQPFSRCYAGQPATSQYVYPNADIYGDGIPGAHGASGLSSIGGTIRMGEMMPGSGPIRHVLKVNVYANDDLHYCSSCGGYRWPAWKADSYASSAYFGSVEACRMGSLLAIPSYVNINNMGLETTPGLVLAQAFQDYGAYIVDDTAWSVYAIETEYSPSGVYDNQFQSAWGFGIEGSDSAWIRDVTRCFTGSYVINNNSASNIGGGGTPRQPLAPPFE